MCVCGKKRERLAQRDRCEQTRKPETAVGPIYISFLVRPRVLLCPARASTRPLPSTTHAPHAPSCVRGSERASPSACASFRQRTQARRSAHACLCRSLPARCLTPSPSSLPAMAKRGAGLREQVSAVGGERERGVSAGGRLERRRARGRDRRRRRSLCVHAVPGRTRGLARRERRATAPVQSCVLRGRCGLASRASAPAAWRPAARARIFSPGDPLALPLLLSSSMRVRVCALAAGPPSRTQLW